MDFKLTSPAFNNGTQIPSKYTCDGLNISPHLVIHGVPDKAKSLALLLEDRDAAEGRGVHWLVWNISPEVRELKEHAVPHASVEGLSYAGPCPSVGTHHYLFTLYALDTKLKLEADSGREELDAAMAQHILATTELMGSYARTNEAPR